ncbi:hypothetical protein J1N35_031167 [Gossypium stocksii]|uniref:Uncharacterized protein n=1 Tax=Gossypium stocksii TaxID=47602 RepID=A0A9D3V0M1_9ROSI|nr:hypothetical protein J1N35_031167 [Gossypium stocksii]
MPLRCLKMKWMFSTELPKRWEVTTGISMPAVAMSRIKWTWVPRKTLPALARKTPATLRICFPEDKTIYKWVKRITDIWVCFGVFRIFKHQNLPGVLPPELVNLPYLKVM